MGLFLGHNAPILTPARAVNGYLYNWYAASDANFAPTDWKVPTDVEWQTLSDYLSGDSVSGGKLKEAGIVHWNTPNTGADNSSGFTLLGSGNRDSGTQNFTNIKAISYNWCVNQFDAIKGYYAVVFYNSASFMITNALKIAGHSIRLLYDGAGTPATVTDYEGRVYDTVVIGTQRWTVQNWACTKLANGNDIPNVTDNSAWAALTTLGRCAYPGAEI